MAQCAMVAVAAYVNPVLLFQKIAVENEVSLYPAVSPDY